MHYVEPNKQGIEERRLRVFIVLAGVFLTSMAILNVVGITKIIEMGPLAVAVGVLPYPITFLCTDLISELYGRSRANFLVWCGLFLNFFILGFLWLGDLLPSASVQPPWQTLGLSSPVVLPNGTEVKDTVELFHLVYSCTAGAVFASMVAYMLAQFVDVYLFHFWKDLTKGKHLWLRNNMSTLVSQLIDSVAVMTITFGMAYWQGQMTAAALGFLILSNYTFKFVAALIDTIPAYILVAKLGRYLEIDPTAQYKS